MYISNKDRKGVKRTRLVARGGFSRLPPELGLPARPPPDAFSAVRTGRGPVAPFSSSQMRKAREITHGRLNEFCRLLERDDISMDSGGVNVKHLCSDEFSVV